MEKADIIVKEVVKKLADGKHIILRPNGSKRVYTVNNSPSMTDQSWHKDTDVNEIMAKFKKTGQISHLSNIQENYGDVSEVPDLDLAMQQIEDAKSAFMALPSALRKKFGNEPAEMINYLQDPRNDEEAIKLGLKSRPKGAEKPKETLPEGVSKEVKGEVSKSD